ncbi:MAG TPA: TadE/TadG family type IV pilus assembly protein [Pyrinomonadaceae bacterium]|nr:TadE/TadG family type IV pilus assembly protein [Pyrinomonadaceae bacterium]
MHARIRRIRNRRRWRRLFDLQRFRRDESGLQLVEVTIVIPIFLIMFGATAEFGRYFYEYTTLAKAARAGSRYLATAPVVPNEDAAARNIVVFGNPAGSGSPLLTGLTTSHVVITREGGVPVLPQRVKVSIVGYQHQPIFDLGALTKSVGLSMTVEVKPSVTMRYLLTQPPPI